MGDRSNSNSSSDFTFSTVGKVATSVMGESTTRVTDDKVSPEEETAHLFAKSETRYVLRLRILVFLALLCAALAVSLTVYFVTTNAEHQQFEVGLEGYSQKIIESFEDILAVRIGAVANLASTYTEFARDRNLTWPFVTMSDYYQRAGNARDLSDSLFINLYPIVTNETRAAWEEYSVQEKGWLDNGRKYQQKTFELPSGRRLQEQEKAVFVGGNSSSGPSLISNTIMKVGGLRDDSPGPYMPAWQGSPILPFPADAVNFNILYLYSKYMTRAVSSGNIVIGRFLAAPPGGLDSTDGASLFFARVNSYAAGKAVHYEGDPVTSFTVPIFDTMEDNKKPVAALFAAFHWASYLKRLLPPNSQPLTVVIENTCDGPFTFTVQGNNVEYIGHGNLHSTSKSSYVRQTIFNMSAHVRTDAGIDYQLYPNECDISLMVYPTDEMFSFYNTNLPLVITIIIVLIFVFTAVMFLLYDRLVERRQRIVMNTAVKSSQIVSSLFPKQIRDRLFAEEGLDGPVHGTKTKLKSFLSGSGDHNAEGQYIGVKPIADLCKLNLLRCFYVWLKIGFCYSCVVRAIAQFWRPLFSLPTLLDSRRGALSASPRKYSRSWSRCSEPSTSARVAVESSRYDPLPKRTHSANRVPHKLRLLAGRNSWRLLRGRHRAPGSTEGSCSRHGPIRSRLLEPDEHRSERIGRLVNR